MSALFRLFCGEGSEAILEYRPCWKAHAARIRVEIQQLLPVPQGSILYLSYARAFSSALRPFLVFRFSISSWNSTSRWNEIPSEIAPPSGDQSISTKVGFAPYPTDEFDA